MQAFDHFADLLKPVMKNTSHSSRVPSGGRWVWHFLTSGGLFMQGLQHQSFQADSDFGSKYQY